MKHFVERGSEVVAREYLKKPYARRLVPDEDGGFVASIQEFPGLVAHGENPADALHNLEAAAESWIEAAVETGQSIPEPIDFFGYSGKISLRIPRGLHKRSAEMASSEGCSLNLWLSTAISHYLGGREATRVAIDAVVKTYYSYSVTNNNLIVGNIGNLEAFTTQTLYGTPMTLGAANAAISSYVPDLNFHGPGDYSFGGGNG